MPSPPFPSTLERTVASALLLLSTTSTSAAAATNKSPPPKTSFDGDKTLTAGSDRRSKIRRKEESLSCSSSLTSDRSSEEITSRKLRIVAVVARCHDLKLKVVRRKRTKVCWSSDHKKAVLALPVAKASSGSTASTEASSCLSSTSSSARSREAKKAHDHEKPKRRFGSARMSRRAESILKLLSGGCYSEVSIRQMLGDSPDTSKALRMLLKRELIKRSGTGGRVDPYHYTIA